ncbi:MAG: BlaI/MecI/CopY family transcriptional regulator [Algicola sp.]|nr:BlaI/MecI/CopY family transcriptional regulator [Algicola sp.]
MKLGELEKLILGYLWQVESADVKQVHLHFEKTRGGSLNTIQSTLDRLYKKALLSRHKVGHAFQYQAKVERHELIGQLIKSVTNDFISEEDDNSLVTAFSSMTRECNQEQLLKLETLIEQQRLKLKQENR